MIEVRGGEVLYAGGRTNRLEIKKEFAFRELRKYSYY